MATGTPHEETSHESQRHPARQGQHALHRHARRAAGAAINIMAEQGHRLAGRHGPRRPGRHAHLPRGDPVPSCSNGGAVGTTLVRSVDGRPSAHLHARNRARRSAPHDARAPRALHAGDGPAHADGRDLLLRRRQGGGRQPELREPHAQGLHPRLAGRRAATSSSPSSNSTDARPLCG